MQEPFPELIYLKLTTAETVSALPDSFLGGSAPRLRHLSIGGISFPGLPRLLLSATYLVELYLNDIPHSGYILPEAMAIFLSTLTSLDALTLEFQSPGSRPDQASRRPPPLTRSVVPTLTYFLFQGTNEYLDDLVTHIDAPRLDNFYITLFDQIVFDPPQFILFISLTPGLKALEKAHISFEDDLAWVKLASVDKMLEVVIICRELNRQILFVEQVCTSPLPPLSTCEDLYITETRSLQNGWRDIIENTVWSELLPPFTAVKNLYLSEEIAKCIAPTLQELVGSRTTEVLPTLETIFLNKLQLSRPAQEGMEHFVAARQVTDHPITISLWDIFADNLDPDWDSDD